MQDEDEILDVESESPQGTAETEETASNGDAGDQTDNRESNELPNLIVDEAGKADDFDYSLPSKEKRQRKAKAKKRIDVEAQLTHLPATAKTGVGRSMSALDHSSEGLDGTGK
jgi:hypothetical protein